MAAERTVEHDGPRVGDPMLLGFTYSLLTRRERVCGRQRQIRAEKDMRDRPTNVNTVKSESEWVGSKTDVRKNEQD